ncbi:hypothetical protein AWM75_00355 [Aerococcus urinaehominis]|uniref:Uncharacterized protein n=1 Tax=Aerococcus urinaehominis TaxID=128944 RepID=A0A0X8FJM4_9LACT|nr:ABC transporter substrate-binding protein [Aerococcus urinaehominis]AMB98534.1 hypothetical protein AWM75_00355 [Aerococcus urinaehominis]SDL79101.1 putative ABC transport system substrate-binding protein [Aerococcus urinaehominis]
MKKKFSITGFILAAALIILAFSLPQLRASFDSNQDQANSDKPVNNQIEHTIGLLQMMDHPALDEIRQGIYDGLAERGYHDGENIEIIYQNGQGDQNNLKRIADNFVAQDVDYLVGIATPAAQALNNASGQTIPVIGSAVSDPVGAGLLENPENPGRPVTAIADHAPIKEQIQLIQEFVPNLKKLGILYTSSEVNVRRNVADAIAYCEDNGIDYEVKTISSTNELKPVAEQLAQEVDAIYIPNDNTIAGAMPTLIAATNAAGVPTFPTADSMIAEGGVATVGINQYEYGLLTAKVIADLIEGANLNAYPVQYNDKNDFYYNDESLKALGIKPPAGFTEKAINVNEKE